MEAIKKIKQKININNIITLFILIQPILDIVTSITVRNVGSSITIGILVRSLFLIGIVIYSLAKCNKKDRINCIIYYFTLLLYIVMFFIVMYNKYGTILIMTQIKGIFKTFYFPILLVSLYYIIKNSLVKIDNKILIYTLFGYTFTIFVAKIFGFGYLSYGDYPNYGTMGLFYAANEIGSILAILASSIVMDVVTEKKKSERNMVENIFKCISVFLLIFAVLELGTKVPFIAFVGLILTMIAFCLIKLLTEDRKKYIKILAEVLVVLLIGGMTLSYTSIGKNIEKNYGIKLFHLDKKNDELNNKKNEELKENEDVENNIDIISSRDLYLEKNMKEFKNENSIVKLLGKGYVTKNDEGQVEVNKLVEMDYFDIFCSNGFIGSALFYLPMIILCVEILKKVFMNIKDTIFDYKIIFNGYSIVISLMIALLAGHVLNAPAVSVFVALYILILNKHISELKSKEEEQ